MPNMEIRTKPFTENGCKQLKEGSCLGVCFSKNKKTGKKHQCPHYKTVEHCTDPEKKPCSLPESQPQ